LAGGRRLDPGLGSRIDAEDVLQSAFIDVRLKRPRFGASGMTPYAWLYQIVRECLCEAWNRENRGCRGLDRKMPWPDRSSHQMAMGLMGSTTRPSQALARGEVKERVRQALDGLRPIDREILWMRRFDGLSIREVASVLAIKSFGDTRVPWTPDSTPARLVLARTGSGGEGMRGDQSGFRFLTAGVLACSVARWPSNPKLCK
jgi:RNA polymerase sigma factor (sigma-70 family)